MPGMNLSQTLARFAVETTYDRIPPAARREGCRTLVNWIGCAVGGSTHPTIDALLTGLAPFGGPAQASVLGRAHRLDALHAALVNGTASHVLDFDDAHLPTLLHPATAIAPALLALAEWKPDGHMVSGTEFLAALVAGVEVSSRLANAIWAQHNRQWYVTGTAGVVGTAVAAGRILGLDAAQMVAAFGIAASQAAGMRGMVGTMCKSFIHGRAAQNGLSAAMLARAGMDGPADPLGGRNGLLAVYSTAPDLEVVTRDLGARYESERNTYKPFACGVVVHAAIDVLIGLREAHAIDPRQVEAIRLAVHPRTLELAGIRAPGSGLESKWSVFHSAAVAIVDGAAGEHQYSDARVRAPDVVAIRDRITATADDTLEETQAAATVILKDGRALEGRVEHVLGSVERPLTDSRLDAKVRALADDILGPARVTHMIGLCRALETLPDATVIAASGVPDGRS